MATVLRSPLALIDMIDSPGALRRLDESLLPDVATEIREFLLRSVSRSGGHLAAGLGTVELTVALHYVYDTPRDALVWDVGHQCYPHKVLTGRRARLHTIRQRGGLSGFLRPEESAYDSFGAGHSSTSISAALGMALANAQLGTDQDAVAIIGDGALTAGLAFEALNHAGAIGADLTVVVNDNGMSISENVGALNDALGDARDGDPSAAAAWFRALGFRYSGPVDGHDLPALLEALRTAKAGQGPRIVHVLTQKGRGYSPAEADPIKYHGVTPFDCQAGLVAKPASLPTYTQVFGDWVLAAAARDPRLVVVTPAMREGSGLVAFARQYPSRFFDVGIAEQHAVTLAAGLAASGLRPVVAIYSTFLQRAYDQLVHDVALQNLPVVFAVDRAGLVGPDGATHNGCLDLSFLRCVPNLTVMAPANGEELQDMLCTGLAHDGPSIVRYPRATTIATASTRYGVQQACASSKLVRQGERVAILAFGAVSEAALVAADRLNATLVNMRFVRPIDARRVEELARSHRLLVTIEENSVVGGAGAAVAEVLAERRLTTPQLMLGVPDRYIEHCTREEALIECGLDADSIIASVLAQPMASDPSRPTRLLARTASGASRLLPVERD